MVEDDLQEYDDHCPFCGSTKRRNICIVQKEPLISFLHCSVCQASSASRMPTESALAEFYEHYYYAPGIKFNAKKYTFDGEARFALHLYQLLSKHTQKFPSSFSILDFGGGDGSLSYRLAEYLIAQGVASVQITVVDYYESIVTSYEPRIIISHSDKLMDQDSQHDLVIASAVLEHLPEAKEYIRLCLKSVKENGFFYARTPFMVPLKRILALVRINLDLTYPAHVHDLGQLFWENLFSSTEFLRNHYLICSQPSIVESQFNEHFLKTLAAYCLKLPWYVFRSRYALVGGWEVFVRKA